MDDVTMHNNDADEGYRGCGGLACETAGVCCALLCLGIGAKFCHTLIQYICSSTQYGHLSSYRAVS